MRLIQHLKEESDERERSDLINDIHDKCNKFLKLSLGLPLYRGKKGYSIEKYKIITSRTDRTPVDMPIEYHELLDEQFESEFGWKARSEGVFATHDFRQANAYGMVYFFFPIGDFKYIWSPKIRDLYIHLDQIADGEMERAKSTINIERVMKSSIEDIVDTYIDNKFMSAIKSEHEITFKCNSYYMVHMAWLLQYNSYYDIFG